jgi:hypothetical protein
MTLKIVLVAAGLLGFLIQTGPSNASHVDTGPSPSEKKLDAAASLRIGKHIRDLDDACYAVREKAMRELEKHGDVAGPALRVALEKADSLEAKVRLAKLLDKQDRFRIYRSKSEAIAREFAKTMLEATQHIEKEYVTPVSLRKQIAWSVRGMFAESNEAMPVAIAVRLKNLDKEDDKELGRVLHDARLHLGLRWYLEDDRALEICLRAIFTQLEPYSTPAERSRYYRFDETLRLRGG